MLYDPKWEKSAAVPSLTGLIAWLEVQKPDVKYDWPACSDCLVAHYIRATTGSDNPAGDYMFHHVIGKHYEGIASPLPWTYGAALNRARALVDR